jgi:hypothetical protein
MSQTVPTQPSAAVQVRLRGTVFDLLENWRRSQPKIPSRSEAMRLLIELALGEEIHKDTSGRGYARRPASRSRVHSYRPHSK